MYIFFHKGLWRDGRVGRQDDISRSGVIRVERRSGVGPSTPTQVIS